MTRPASGRILLCRPRGGLNDALCRIERCWRFAEHTGRHLIVDSSKSALHGLFGQLFTVVTPHAGVTLRPDAALLESLDHLVCRPAELQGRVSTYEVRVEQGRYNVDTATGVLTRFASKDIGADTPDCPEPLLIYDDWGGGTESFDLLSRVRFTDAVASRLRDALRAAGASYSAVHVRNTDYRTDYERLFARIKRRVRGHPLLVCSDDPEVIAYARRSIGSRIIEPGGYHASTDPTGALHLPGAYASSVELQESVFVALRDLVLLANATRLYVAPVEQVVDHQTLDTTGRIAYRAVGRGQLSGFSRLAQLLCDRKDILDALLNVPIGRRRRASPGAAVTVLAPSVRLRLWLRRVLRPSAGKMSRAEPGESRRPAGLG